MSYVYTHVHTSTIFLELTFFFVAVFHKEWFERNEFTKSEASNRKVVPLLESIYFSLLCDLLCSPCSALDSFDWSHSAHATFLPECNSQHKLARVAANFVANNCTGTMIPLRSLKELRSNVGCVVEMDFMLTAGRKKHWPKVGRWKTTPNFNATIDARCAMPTLPHFKRRAKLLNRWRSGSRKKKLGPSRI